MKILRVFGVVVGIHLFAFLLIFANPGCSSTGKPAPKPADTAAKNEPAPVISSPVTASSSSSASPVSAAPLGAESAPAISFTLPSSAGRYSPTRPGTTAATALEANPVADITPASTYTVVAGDSLSVIAKRNKITSAELAATNNLKLTSPLRPGQKLIIPAKAPTATPAASTPAAAAPAAVSSATEKPAGEVVKHTVKSGETLGSIAQQYGVKMKDVGTDNHITDPAKIRPGQELTIKLGKRDAAKPSGNSSSANSAAKAAAPRTSSPSPAPAASRPAQAAPASASTFSAPPPGQDLDAGLRPGSGNDVPVIKVEEAPAPK